MAVCRYRRTLATIKERLLARFPDTRPVQGATGDASHTLWMIQQIGCMEDQGKIDRWVGWISAKAHSLGVIDSGDDELGELRRLARSDLGDP